MTDDWQVTEQGLVGFAVLVLAAEGLHSLLDGYTVRTATIVFLAVAQIVATLSSRKYRLKYETELRRRLQDD